MLAKIVLALSGAVFVGIGVMFLAFPERMVPNVSIVAPPGTALTDVRAVYGGLDAAIGVFLLYCLAQSQVRIGLLAGLLTLGGLACGRVLGIALDGQQAPITYYLLTSEVLGAVICGVARWTTRSNRS
jgi:hypothetical protein